MSHQLKTFWEIEHLELKDEPQYTDEDQDVSEKDASRNWLGNEMEQYQDVWRQEMKELGSVVARLQEENSKLSQCKREMATSAADNESLQQQLEASQKASQEQGRRNRRLQQQMRQLCDECGDLQALLHDQQGQLQALQERLRTTVRDHDDLLLHAQDASCAEMKRKLVIDLDNPTRPRFTLEELKHILFEKNELKVRVSDLEDELALYRPKRAHEATSLLTRPADLSTPVKDDDLPVHGPINQQPEEKRVSLGRSSDIWKFFPSTLWARVKPG
ncbi:RILP-like protein 1 [Haemaphysalis longicornis]